MARQTNYSFAELKAILEEKKSQGSSSLSNKPSCLLLNEVGEIAILSDRDCRDEDLFDDRNDAVEYLLQQTLSTKESWRFYAFCYLVQLARMDRLLPYQENILNSRKKMQQNHALVIAADVQVKARLQQN